MEHCNRIKGFGQLEGESEFPFLTTIPLHMFYLKMAFYQFCILYGTAASI